MTALECYTDAILSGRILDIGPGSTAQEVEDVLGRAYIDDTRRKTMRRDYGLVEVHFSRHERFWACFGATIQVHRLAELGSDIVPAPLRERYGQFDRFLNVRHLRDTVGQRHGIWIDADDEPPQEFQTYRIASTRSVIHVVGNRDRQRNDEPGFGDIWSIELRSAGQGERTD